MKGELITIRTSCRVCGFKPLVPLLSLGKLHVSDFVSGQNQREKKEKYPLELVLCNKKSGGCGLVQLKHTVPPQLLYRNYWYRSGMNKTMSEELRGIAEKAEMLVHLSTKDYVIDIGANDGTLLRGYIKKPYLVGFEPARNLMKYARKGTAKIINDFFSFAAWEKAFGKAKAKVITAIAMFYDLEDPNSFVTDVAKCLHGDGILIIQMSYLPSMLTQNAFDNVVHEHLQYYSLLSLEHLLTRHNLEVFDVELNDVNGGSFRIYIRHKNGGKSIQVPRGAAKRVRDLRKYEESLRLDEQKVYDDFVKRVYKLRSRLTAFIGREVERGKKVYAYGASTKGNTLLQFYNLNHKLIKAAAERNPDKWGTKTVGTNIPIISEEQARREKPDYFLVLPWHFLDEFVEREHGFLKQGGKFIVPLPKFRIIGKGLELLQ